MYVSGLIVVALCSVVAADGDCTAASERIDATLRDEAHKVRVWRVAWGIGATVVAGGPGGLGIGGARHGPKIEPSAGPRTRG